MRKKIPVNCAKNLMPKALGEAIEHHRAGRMAQAEGIYKKILSLNPTHPDALHLLGVLNHQLGNNELAAELINKAIKINPNVADFHSNYGNVLKALGRMGEATASYRQAISIKPDYVEAYSNLGDALRYQGLLDEAIASFRQAITLKPSYADAYNNLGLALKQQGDLNEAEANFRRALEIRPAYAVAYNNLGNTLKGQGRLEDAIKSYHQAIAIEPKYAAAISNLGVALHVQGLQEKAVEFHKRALTLMPNYAEGYSNLGLSLQELGHLKEAVSWHRESLNKNGRYANAYYNLHALMLDFNNLPAAIECMKKAVSISPDDFKYRLHLGILLDYSGDFENESGAHFSIAEVDSSLMRARLDAWRYIKSKSVKLPLMFGSNISAFQIGLAAALPVGMVLEFGVRNGTSIRQIAALVKQDVHGFDSFEGLPEAWHHEPKGSYTTKGQLPTVPENVTLHVGWFEDTLPFFLSDQDSIVRFVNIDCDIYSSTKTVLDSLASSIVAGTVIVFDEYIGNEFWREDEFKAFQEAAAKYGWKYEYLAFSFFTKQVVVRIL